MRQIFGFTSREIMQFESKTVWLHETNQKLGIHAKTASQILAPSATVLNIRARRFKMSIVVWILWKFLHFFTDFFSFYIPIFIGLYLDGPLFRLMNVGELKSVISEPVTTAAWTAINELLWFEICVFFFFECDDPKNLLHLVKLSFYEHNLIAGLLSCIELNSRTTLE